MDHAKKSEARPIASSLARQAENSSTRIVANVDQGLRGAFSPRLAKSGIVIVQSYRVFICTAADGRSLARVRWRSTLALELGVKHRAASITVFIEATAREIFSRS